MRVVSNGTTANYKYDGLGRRVEKEVISVSTTVTRYIFDNEDILLELDGSNNITARYTHEEMGSNLGICYSFLFLLQLPPCPGPYALTRREWGRREWGQILAFAIPFCFCYSSRHVPALTH